jgi:hypothetical protein
MEGAVAWSARQWFNQSGGQAACIAPMWWQPILSTPDDAWNVTALHGVSCFALVYKKPPAAVATFSLVPNRQGDFASLLYS